MKLKSIRWEGFGLLFMIFGMRHFVVLQIVGILTSKLWFQLYRYSAQVFAWLDHHFVYTSPYMTTGWAVRVLKL